VGRKQRLKAHENRVLKEHLNLHGRKWQKIGAKII
jgi:hypothetical protein